MVGEGVTPDHDGGEQGEELGQGQYNNNKNPADVIPALRREDGEGALGVIVVGRRRIGRSRLFIKFFSIEKPTEREHVGREGGWEGRREIG